MQKTIMPAKARRPNGSFAFHKRNRWLFLNVGLPTEPIVNMTKPQTIPYVMLAAISTTTPWRPLDCTQ